jgi:hypothetical protein
LIPATHEIGIQKARTIGIATPLAFGAAIFEGFMLGERGEE